MESFRPETAPCEGPESSLLWLPEVTESILRILGPDALQLHAAARALLTHDWADALVLLTDSFSNAEPRIGLVAIRCGARGITHDKAMLLVNSMLDIASMRISSKDISSRCRACMRILSVTATIGLSELMMPRLSHSVGDGDLKLVHFLVDLKADINQQDPSLDDKTPLMVAVTSPDILVGKKLIVCEELLDIGAELSVCRRSDGKTVADIFRESSKTCRSWRRLQELLQAY
mmetsp:Transcript_28508/g.60494  ORF Transcript_28508/g.60494 Transcript_28508/m.60494 type:complete len:232 (-) Transcript_28508:129-824(-)